MEREYKWKASAKDFEAILNYLSLDEEKTVPMFARYYDTTERLLRARKIGLRMRYEGDQSVCCLKLRDASNEGLHAREEYECQAETLESGVEQLPKIGAPAELCRALYLADLHVVCETSFGRRIAIWEDAQFTAELSYDAGCLSCNGTIAPISEIECEQKGGDEAAFEAACRALTSEFHLKTESKSKLSRALDLERAPL